MIDTLAPFIGMGIVSAGIAIIYYLAIKGEKDSKKKPTIIVPPGCERSLGKQKR